MIVIICGFTDIADVMNEDYCNYLSGYYDMDKTEYSLANPCNSKITISYGNTFCDSVNYLKTKINNSLLFIASGMEYGTDLNDVKKISKVIRDEIKTDLVIEKLFFIEDTVENYSHCSDSESCKSSDSDSSESSKSSDSDSSESSNSSDSSSYNSRCSVQKRKKKLKELQKRRKIKQSELKRRKNRCKKGK
jgi:hypothetical protein